MGGGGGATKFSMDEGGAGGGGGAMCFLSCAFTQAPVNVKYTAISKIFFCMAKFFYHRFSLKKNPYDQDKNILNKKSCRVVAAVITCSEDFLLTTRIGRRMKRMNG
jgi:hypothetical protein